MSGDPRRQIALASRALAAAGLFDMHGHVSVREGDAVWIQSRQRSRATVRPEDVARVRVADGAKLSGDPPSETPLHLGAYRARADVMSVAHFHPLAATAFAVAGRPLVAAFNAGAPFGQVVPVYDDPDLVRDDAQGRAAAAVLGTARAALLCGHGVLVVGADIKECLAASLFLEESARRLAFTYGLGQPRPFTADEIARVTASLWQPSVVAKTWDDAIERARLAGFLSGLD